MASAGGTTINTPILLRLLEHSLHTSFDLFQNEALDRLEDAIPTSVVDEYTGRKRVRKVCLGDMRVARIRKLLESGFGVTRSKMQVEFHEAFLAATSRHLYMDDNDVNWAKVKAQQGWKDTRSVVLCQTPRRFGKTWSVGLFIAAYVVCVSGSEQSIFSTGKRASSKMLELIKGFVQKVVDPKDIVKSNAEILVLNHRDGKKSLVNSYPAASKTLRGSGGDVLWLEEAAFMPPSLFFEGKLGFAKHFLQSLFVSILC